MQFGDWSSDVCSSDLQSLVHPNHRLLSEEFKKAIDDWDAQEIVLSEDANQVRSEERRCRERV